jgi:hypothetical protein
MASSNRLPLVMTRQGVTHDTVPYFMERFGDAYAAKSHCVLYFRRTSA